MQEFFAQLQEALMGSLGTFTNSFSMGFSKIVGALIIWIVGWLVIRLIRRLINKVLTSVQFDNVTDKMNLTPYMEQAGVTMTPSAMVSKFVSFVMILMLILALTNYLGLDEVSAMINDFIGYLPNLFVAIGIMAIGLWFANIARGVVRATTSSIGASSSGIISGFAFYGIITMVTLIALRKAGIETEIIDNNLTNIVLVLLGAFGIAYGLGAKEIMRNMISGFFSKKKYAIGQTIKVGEVKGKIIEIDSISLSLKTTSGVVVVPAKDIVEEQVEIIV